MAKRRLDIQVRGQDQNATRLFKGLDRGLAAVGNRVKLVAAGFAAAFTTRAIIRNIAETTKEIDKLAKVSAKLGTTVGILSSLGHAANLTGVNINTMQMAVQRMTRRVSEAAVGTGEAKDAILELGLNAEKLTDLDLDEKLGVIAHQFAGVKSPADKLRLAFKLFDSEGAVMVNLLAAGNSGLAEMLEQFRALGGVVDEGGVGAVEDMNDAWTRFKVLLNGVSNEISVNLAPVFENFITFTIIYINIFTQAVDRMDKVWEAMLLSAAIRLNEFKIMKKDLESDLATGLIMRIAMIGPEVKDPIFGISMGGLLSEVFGLTQEELMADLRNPEGHMRGGRGGRGIDPDEHAASKKRLAELREGLDVLSFDMEDSILDAGILAQIQKYFGGDRIPLTPDQAAATQERGPRGRGGGRTPDTVRPLQTRFLTGVTRHPLLSTAQRAERQRDTALELEQEQVDTMKSIDFGINQMLRNSRKGDVL